MATFSVGSVHGAIRLNRLDSIGPPCPFCRLSTSEKKVKPDHPKNMYRFTCIGPSGHSRPAWPTVESTTSNGFLL